MAREVINATNRGDIQVHPDSQQKQWYRWLESVDDHDWCVSRQLWWGHQIPAYCVRADDQEFWVAARSKEDAKAKVAEKEGRFGVYCSFM